MTFTYQAKPVRKELTLSMPTVPLFPVFKRQCSLLLKPTVFLSLIDFLDLRTAYYI